MKNLIRCVLSAVLLSSIPASALTIPRSYQKQKKLETHIAYLSAPKKSP
ncbi:hypothetical protein LP090_08410 [Moraxella bovis]|nr:hypothetical protein [Moraxella bovis]UYZ69355.1 hypothetical protein LP122_04575 [Moraxella bovis]UYZ88555.1 hypothetical protein LP114_08790 [Moraxella bovis]UZA26621.1 hypothetical protein LP119_08280 [Moraxella bovis]UZA38848.1 hypothetical protein LP101_04590 [Moraxella bovis]UZA42242.1 hypothetical protein LP090_08410 [Moraxella bovis]